MDGFNSILDTGKEEDLKMIKDKKIGEKIVSIFIGILKNKGSKKIKQILLHWFYYIK